MIKCGRGPYIGCVTFLTGMRHLSCRMGGCFRIIVIGLVTAPAFAGSPRKHTADMALLTNLIDMRSCQDKCGLIMIECGWLPYCRVVALRAIEVELRRRMIRRVGIPITGLMAGEAFAGSRCI